MFLGAKEFYVNDQTYCVSFGRGEKPLVMIQGLNTNSIKGSSLMLSALYRIFGKKYRVYLFDRRKDLFDGITVRDFAFDIALAMDALAISNADVLGVSQGGMIASYLAIDRPDLVRKLVLAVSASRTNDLIRDAIDEWVSLNDKKEWGKLVRDMAKRMYSPSYLKRYKLFMPLLALAQKPKDPMRFSVLATSCLTCNAYEELEKIKCPVLIIGGSEDKIVGEEASLEIANKLECEFYIYKGLGHALYEEAKDFNKRVLQFFEK